MEKLDQTFDPLTGTLTRTFIEDDKLVIRKDADISQAVQWTTALRNDEGYWKQGVKNNLAHVAHIPDVVIAELYGIGVNVFTAPAKEIISGLRRLNKEYLLTTNKRV
jgi:hypothetical protein